MTEIGDPQKEIEVTPLTEPVPEVIEIPEPLHAPQPIHAPQPDPVRVGS